MCDMTMGQRIAERRRLLGLSQEALGEKLGLSRQAVSKWESDGAVPEIDKLIAMSRLFGVSVGWLLGTEEPGDAEPEEPAVEPVTRQPGWDQRKLLRMAAVVCLVLTIAVICLWASVARLRDSLDGCLLQISQLRSSEQSLRSELASLDAQLQSLEAGAEDSSLLSDYSWEILSMNGSDHGRVFFTLIPKSWSEGDTATIVARYKGEAVASEECAWDGSAYTGRLILPPENGYEYYFTVTCSIVNELGEVVSRQEHQRLQAEEAENVGRQLRVGCSFGMREYSIAHKEGVLTLVDAAVSVAMPESVVKVPDYRVSWDAMDLVLYQNGVEVDRVSPPGLLADGDRSSIFHATVEQAELRFEALEEGDSLELWLEVRLSNGMTGRAFGEGWLLENGELTKLAVVAPD